LLFFRREDYTRSGMLPIIERLDEELGENRYHANDLAVVYVECVSPGEKRLKVIPENRSSWIA